MNIDRHNYEEFFILYMDNELSSAERSKVELFVKEHADLAIELEMLQQTRLVADSSLVYKGKNSLLKTAADSEINMNNYEEWLLLYTDDELTIEQEIAVENFAITHPEAKKELDLLQKTKLQADDTILFFDKSSLYRSEEKERRAVGIRWWRIAAAAALLFAISITGFLLSNKKSSTDPIASGPTEVPPVKKALPALSTGLEAKKNIAPVKNNEAFVKNNAASNKETRPKTRDTKNTNTIIPKEIKNNQPDIAVAQKEKGNNLPAPVYNPNMKEKVSPVEDFAVARKNVLTNSKEINPHASVTSGTPQSFIQTGNTLTSDEPEQEMTAKKTKFRGLLRKITRTFEKTTNIKATDEQDRLLVGGLAIRL